MKEYHNEITKMSSSELRDPGNLLLLVYITAIVCVLLLGVLWDVAGAMVGEEGMRGKVSYVVQDTPFRFVVTATNDLSDNGNLEG